MATYSDYTSQTAKIIETFANLRWN